MFSRFKKRKVYRDLRIEGAELQLDGTIIERCTLVGCTLIYSGGDLPMMNDNTILDAQFELRGGSARTVQLLQFLKVGGAYADIHSIRSQTHH